MVTKRKASTSSGQRGSTLYGVLAGVLLGLVVAAVVAFYVTRAPNPFVDRASRQDSTRARPTGPSLALSDPNRGLSGGNDPAGAAPSGPTPPAPLPGVGVQPPPADWSRSELDDLIAQLPETSRPTLPASKAGPPSAQTDRPATPTVGNPVNAKPAAKGIYLLQAGAFRQNEDAESLRARIILLGLPVNVQRADLNGVLIHRVRVGPYAKLDDMNRARALLGEKKIESAVVRE